MVLGRGDWVRLVIADVGCNCVFCVVVRLKVGKMTFEMESSCEVYVCCLSHC